MVACCNNNKRDSDSGQHGRGDREKERGEGGVGESAGENKSPLDCRQTQPLKDTVSLV